MSEEIMAVEMTEVSQHIVINQDRTVAVPSLLKKSIVQHDHNIERLTFDCPRYWYGKDISTLNIYVNYIAASQKSKGKDPGSSLCENVVIDENDQNILHFDWVITDNVSEHMGGLIFLVCAKSVDSDGNEDIHWNSHLCKEMEVQEGLEASSAIVKRYPDVIESILSKLGKQIELRNSGTAIQYRNAGENTWVDLVNLADIKGEPGTPGKNGEPGKNGITPHIGENNHWYIGETDTGVTAQGADGYTPQKGVDYTDGADGKSAYQYAQEGGYTGTEAEFAQKLANELQLDTSLKDNTKAAPAGIVGDISRNLEDLVINVKSYGINGDGETDTSQLFTQLVTELNENGGGTIYLPNGKYRLNSRITWKSNVSLVGESHNAILMPYCDNSVSQGFAAISWLSADGSKQDGYDAPNPFVNCHFKNFTIDGINQNPSSYDSYPKGINIHFLKDCSFENLQFLNIFATGLGIDFLENVFIRNIYCYNCGRGYTPTSDEKIAGGAGIGIGTMGMEKESCIISDCITDGCGNYGIFLEGGSIFPENGCESHYTIANCQCINGRNYGIAVKGTDNVMVSNNIMRNNARDGFAMLPRKSRCCANVQITGNLSASNSGCGYRFADGDGADYISEKIYIKNNVSEGNEKDGILISSILRNMFVENNIFESNDRAIAISSKSFQNLYFAGNRIRDCATNLVFDGSLDNANLFNNQIVQMIGVHEKEYNSVYVDDSGMEIEHTSSKTTKDFTYCKGSLYCGFYFASSYEQTGTENRICYCHWYDENINFISREGATVNGSGWKRFTPPEGACYVKYRVGINTGNLQNSQLKGVYLMRYMSDRCEIN